MPDTAQPDPYLDAQLAQLDIKQEHLVICDIDEVVLHFLKPFRIFLQENGYRLGSSDYSLNNNIMKQTGDQTAGSEETRAMITKFFDAEIGNQPLVEGAQTTLNNLSAQSQIIFLTNIPYGLRSRRIIALENHGLKYPLITHSGPKGPTVERLANQTSAQVFFLDDSPSNLTSINSPSRNIHLIQFVADDVFFHLAPDLAAVQLKTNVWADVGTYITRHLTASTIDDE
ncbi:MAG: hypothetical protein ABJN26_06395 [Stappiaceae bacterium]